MDVFSHGLWGGALVYPKLKNNRLQRYMAVLFGVLPDIIPFAPAFVYMLFMRSSFDPGTFNTASGVFAFAREAYNFTHSLVIFASVLGLCLLVRRGKMYWPLAAWGLHILMDIPTHPEFFQTPFLFPLSSYKISWGISWANPWALLVNWAALGVVYLFILRDVAKRQGFRTLLFLNKRTNPMPPIKYE